MNQEGRKFLIDQYVKGQPIYYEAIGQILGLDLGLESQRQMNSPGQLHKNENDRFLQLSAFKVG